MSILVPVHNARPWVRQALKSATRQSWPNIEVIALDDASTDGSWEVLSEWKGRIRAEHSEQNRGQNGSRNKLTAISRGEWLVFLDADDELAPDSVERKMEQTLKADCVYGTMDVRHYEGTVVVQTERVQARSFDDPLLAAFEWRFPNTSSVMLRRTALLEAGGWNENIQNCTDYELYFRMLVRDAHFVAAPESVTVYRQWSREQAVHQDPLRRITTRLNVMWHAVKELERTGKLTAQRRDAFANSTLAVLRVLFPFAPAEARLECNRIAAWYPGFVPSPAVFPPHYCIAYKWLGFRLAEQLAHATRFLRDTPSKTV